MAVLIIGAKEIAKQIGVQPRHIKELVETGRLKAWMHNRVWRTTPEDLEQYVKKERRRYFENN